LALIYVHDISIIFYWLTITCLYLVVMFSRSRSLLLDAYKRFLYILVWRPRIHGAVQETSWWLYTSWCCESLTFTDHV